MEVRRKKVPTSLWLGNAGFGSATGRAAMARSLFGRRLADYWAGDLAKKRKSESEAVAKGARTNSNLAMPTPSTYWRVFGGRDLLGTVGAILALCA